MKVVIIGVPLMPPDVHQPTLDRIGPFEVDRVLAEGGMSIVYEGRDPRVGRRVAIKTVTLPSESYLSSLRREIHALSRVKHPAVVEIIDQGVVRGVPWYAMPLYEGETLSGFAQRLWGRVDHAGAIDSAAATADGGRTAALRPVAKGDASADDDIPLPVRLTAAGGDLPRALTVVRRLCGPLAYLHGLGIVHRDLKPHNIVITPGDRPVVVDFGLAWRVAGGPGREAPDVLRDLVGTPEYMAPEQATLDRVDPRTDLYAVGCILFALITGRPPFVASTTERVIQKHLSESPRSMTDFVDGVPAGLDALVLALLAKHPRDRIGHASDVARVLEEHGAAPEPDEPAYRTYVYGPNLAGRTDVFVALENVLARARRRDGGVTVVRGPSGVGKTYLVVDVARQCSLGMRVVTCECSPLARPLAPMQGLLTAIGDRCRFLGANVTERIVADRGRILAEIDPSFAELPGQHRAPEPLTGAAARDRLLAALRDTLGAFAETNPLVLIIDDLHWADELTLRFWATLPEGWLAERSIAVLATCRDGESLNPITELCGRAYVDTLELGALDRGAVGSLVRDMLAVEVAPPALVDTVTEQSGGNPFYVAEYLRSAVEEGHIVRRSSRRVDIGALPPLSSLQQLVERRLAGLGADARLAVDVASVFGRETALDLLIDRVTGELGDRDRALDAVSELTARHVLEQPGPVHVRFIHDKLQEIAYDRLSPARRRELHRASAGAIGARSRTPEERRSMALVLAFHFERAGDRSHALDQLELAGDASLAGAAFRRAARCYEHALELATDRDASAERRAHWRVGLAQARLGEGELDGVEGEAMAALELLGMGAPRSRAGWRLRLSRELATQVAHLVGVRRRAPASAEVLGRAAVAAGLLSHRYFYVDDALGMLTSSLMSVNLAERAALGTRVPRPYVQLAFASGLLGLHPVARGYFTRARTQARNHTDPIEVAFAEMVEAVYLSSLGRWDDAEPLAQRAHDRLRVLYDPTLFELAQTTLGHIEFYTGRLVEARERYQALLSSARERSSAQHATWGLFSIARSELELGAVARARELLEEARAALSERPELQSEIIVGGLLARARLELGDDGGALLAADQTYEHMRTSRPIGYPVLEGYRGVAAVYVARWRDRADARGRDGALRMRKQMARIARVFPVARPAAQLHAAEVARLSGRPRAARTAATRSLQLARSLAMPRDERLALAALSSLTD